MTFENLSISLYNNLYINRTNYLNYAIGHQTEYNYLQELAQQISKRNAQYQEHPTDSLIEVLLSPDTKHTAEIQDKALERFIMKSLIVSILQIEHVRQTQNLSKNEAIQLLYDNGFFTWFAGSGRHAASEDYQEIIEILKRANYWID